MSENWNPTALVGSVLGRHIIERLIGEGGMGAVFAARHQDLRRTAAVKVLQARYGESVEAQRRFAREGRAAARIRHPNIVDVYDIASDGGRIYLVMDLLDGENLRSLLARERRLSAEQAADLLVPVVAALAAAHAQGVVHRDLKPENIFLSQERAQLIPKVLDFGVALLDERDPVESLTRTGALIGTPYYMSPEQARGDRALDGRSDQYSVGAILYECVTGQRPFEEPALYRLLQRIAGGDFARPRQRVPELAAGFEGLIVRAMACDRAERFEDARAFGRALLEFAGPRVRDGYAHELARGGAAPLSDAEPREAAGAPEAPRVELAATAREAAPGPSQTAAGQELSETRLPLRPSRRSRRARAALAALLLVAVGGLVWLRGRAATTESRVSALSVSVPSPLAKDWVLACPPLVAVGADEPGWLGAAAAATFCARARLLLGGRPEHTRVPAALLDLPPTPTTNFPAAPYDGVDARERALAAAREANAYLDGEVRDLGADFAVELTLRSPDGRALASGRGSSPALYAAIREATVPLVAGGALPMQPLDPGIGRWLTAENVDEALALFDVQLAAAHNAGTFDSECATVARLGKSGAQFDYARWLCAYVRGRTVPSFGAPPPSSKDAAEFAQQAFLFRMAHNTDSRRIALELQAFRRDPANGDWGRSVLGGLESCFWQSIDLESAQSAALLAVKAAPQNTDSYCNAWGMLLMTQSNGRNATPARVPGALGAAHAAAAWVPWGYFNAPLMTAEQGDAARDVKKVRHAYRLAPENAVIEANLFDVLLARGDREAARVVALRYRGHEAPVLALESEILLSRLDAYEGRFGAALERARRALQAPAADGYTRDQSMDLAWHAFEFAQVLGRERQVADEVVRTLILDEPMRIGPTDDLTRAAPLCVTASPAVGERCVARLSSLIESGYSRDPTAISGVLLQAAAFCVSGELERAAALLRPLATTAAVREAPIAWLMVHVLDGVGSRDLADEVDRAVTPEVGEFNGASLADVRRARRHAKDDPRLAAELAREVLGAWRSADQTPAVLPEMRALAAHRDRAPEGSTRYDR